jgi:hypothetical protein
MAKKKDITLRYWMCMIGAVPKDKLPIGADAILRQPVRNAFNNTFGTDMVCNSGWGIDEETYDMLSYIKTMKKEDLKKLYKIAKIINQIR